MTPVQDLAYFVPELLLTACAIFVLMLGLFSKGRDLPGAVTFLGIAGAIYLLAAQYGYSDSYFSGMLTNDPFSRFFKIVCLLASAIVVLISLGYRVFPARDAGEFYFLLLVLSAGMMLVSSSNDLLMIYISLEAVSIVSYILVAFAKHDPFSGEGALKYFLFGTLSTGIMLFGISYVYGIFGTTGLPQITAALESGKVSPLAAAVPAMLILAGFAFKCALVPFHMWVPDAYQGAPTPVTALISAGPKAAGFAVLLRVFMKGFVPLAPGWTELICVISVLTMTAGNIVALSQSNIKRMLGYSSIAQAGYVLIGVAAGTGPGMSAVLYYVLAYCLMNLGAFACVMLIHNSLETDRIEDYAGLYRSHPSIALLFTVFLLSLAGIPPLAGFWGKFLVFASAIEAGFVLLAVAGVLNSVIALYYYVRVVKFMYLDEPAAAVTPRRSPMPLRLAAAIALCGVLLAGIWPDPFITWITRAIW